MKAQRKSKAKLVPVSRCMVACRPETHATLLRLALEAKPVSNISNMLDFIAQEYAKGKQLESTECPTCNAASSTGRTASCHGLRPG